MRLLGSPSTRARAIGFAAALALAASLLAGAGPLADAAEGAKRPNIILITSDDQTLSSYDERTMPKTAKLLGGKGTTFTNGIVTTPLCCPSRASMITGQYAHNHGVTSNRLGYSALKQKDNTLPVWLDRAGYKTAHVGKYLNGYGAWIDDPAEVAPGWDIWYTTKGSTRYYEYDVAANGKLLSFGLRDREHVSRVINRKAKTLARRLTRNKKPLYLQVDHRAPHTETGIETRGGCKGRAVPDPEDRKLFKREPLPQPPSYNEADVSDKPSFIQGRGLIEPARLKKLTKRWRCSLGALRAVDRGVKEIVKAVKKTGELRKTVIAFISDNGFYNGEHRIKVGKIYPYEEGIRVPFLLRVPERYRGGGARIGEIPEPVGNIDLAPTFLELGRARPCRGGGVCRVMDGRSLLGLVSGRQGSFPDGRAMVTEFDVGNGTQDGLCSYSGVRLAGASYVEYTLADDLTDECEPTPERELYGLAQDPFQLQNLAGGGATGLEADLSGRLERLRDCAGIAGRDARVGGRPYCE